MAEWICLRRGMIAREAFSVRQAAPYVLRRGMMVQEAFSVLPTGNGQHFASTSGKASTITHGEKDRLSGRRDSVMHVSRVAQSAVSNAWAKVSPPVAGPPYLVAKKRRDTIPPYEPDMA